MSNSERQQQRQRQRQSERVRERAERAARIGETGIKSRIQNADKIMHSG